MVKTLHFKSKEDYRKWLSYGHMHTKTGLKTGTKGRKNLFESTPGHSNILIAGKKHKVKH